MKRLTPAVMWYPLRGPQSEWVARCLEELGHEVIVADPDYAPM